jgi:hypothetical protein
MGICVSVSLAAVTLQQSQAHIAFETGCQPTIVRMAAIIHQAQNVPFMQPRLCWILGTVKSVKIGVWPRGSKLNTAELLSTSMH